MLEKEIVDMMETINKTQEMQTSVLAMLVGRVKEIEEALGYINKETHTIDTP